VSTISGRNLICVQTLMASSQYLRASSLKDTFSGMKGLFTHEAKEILGVLRRFSYPSVPSLIEMLLP
jgi:hypothetical protein